MLDDTEIRLECLRLAAVLHENDVPDVTQLIATSEALRDYVIDGRQPLGGSPPGSTSEQTIGEMFSGYINKRRT